MSAKKSKDNYNVDVEHMCGSNGCHPDCPACEKPTHTPTPWELKGSYIVGDGNTVLNLTGAMAGDDTDADAAFIVRAVNAHEDLLLSLKRLESDPDDKNARAEARRVIAKAEDRS